MVCIGMVILSDIEHFDRGEIIGIIHLDGQKAVDKFCAEHPEIFEALKNKKRVNNGQ
jgi:hypothetical protein